MQSAYVATLLLAIVAALMSVPTALASDYSVSYFWFIAPLNLSYHPQPGGPVLVETLHPLQVVTRSVVQAVNVSGITRHQPVDENGRPTGRIFTACVGVANSRCLIFTNRTGGVVGPLWNVTDHLNTILFLPPADADVLASGQPGEASSRDPMGSDPPTTTTPIPSDRRRFGEQLDNGGFEYLPCPNRTITGFNASWYGELDVSEVYSKCISFYVLFVVADENQVNNIGTPGGAGDNNDNGRNWNHNDPSNEFFPNIYPLSPPNLTQLINVDFTNNFVVQNAQFLNMTSRQRYEHVLRVGHNFSVFNVFNGTTDIITNSGPATGIPYGTIFAICGGIGALAVLLLLYLAIKIRRRRLAAEEADAKAMLNNDVDHTHMTRNSMKKKGKRGNKRLASVIGSSYQPVAADAQSDSRWEPPRTSVRGRDESFCTMDTRAAGLSVVGGSTRDLESPCLGHHTPPIGVTPPNVHRLPPASTALGDNTRASGGGMSNGSFSEDGSHHLLPTTTASTGQFREGLPPTVVVVPAAAGSTRASIIRTADIEDQNAIQ